ncbi:hypothetical protein B0H17DRAFT_1146677 [Mycena rosella]|uniref:Uncharacterized protein n=1 Tax=Mycena rosella TaxID=1033263 RepID=A0AAD7CNG6_MYCRO|nr:hypothetical protein B0H17DRAFT_1146677 [Mycena rosella]
MPCRQKCLPSKIFDLQLFITATSSRVVRAFLPAPQVYFWPTINLRPAAISRCCLLAHRAGISACTLQNFNLHLLLAVTPSFSEPLLFLTAAPPTGIPANFRAVAILLAPQYLLTCTYFLPHHTFHPAFATPISGCTPEIFRPVPQHPSLVEVYLQEEAYKLKKSETVQSATVSSLIRELSASPGYPVEVELGSGEQVSDPIY